MEEMEQQKKKDAEFLNIVQQLTDRFKMGECEGGDVCIDRLSAKCDLPIKMMSETAKMPTKGSDRAAGLDLYADIRRLWDINRDAFKGEEDQYKVYLYPGQTLLIPLGFSIALPYGTEAQARPRSGLACKHGITVANSPGTIDEDYRGEMMIGLVNHSKSLFVINHHDRIAQMVVTPVIQANLVKVEELDDTTRGSGGFGSTGK
jgi:dUTP pyrophosphatase